MAGEKTGTREEVPGCTNRRPNLFIMMSMITGTWWNGGHACGGARGGGGMVSWCMGTVNRMVIELAMRRMMSTSYRDSHANGRRVAYGIVQRLQVRMSCG